MSDKKTAIITGASRGIGAGLVSLTFWRLLLLKVPIADEKRFTRDSALAKVLLD
jgi:hypothetical protein